MLQPTPLQQCWVPPRIELLFWGGGLSGVRMVLHRRPLPMSGSAVMLARHASFVLGCLALCVALISASSAQAQTPPATAPAAPTAVAVYGFISQELRVLWSTADYANTTGFKIQWKSGAQEYDSSRQAAAAPAASLVTATSTTSSRRYQHTITGLTDDTEYTVQVIATNAVGDSSPSAGATGTPEAVPQQMAVLIENEVVAIHESAFPWLRETWDYIRRNVSVHLTTGTGGAVINACISTSISTLSRCEAATIRIGRYSTRLIHLITHEMAHVYTLTNGVTNRPGPLGIAHVYFSELDLQGTKCQPDELYADMLMILVHGDPAREQSTYWSECPGTTDTLTAAALAVVRSATSSAVPSWFANTYHDAGGEPDQEQFWADVKAISDSHHAHGGCVPAPQKVRRLLQYSQYERSGLWERGDEEPVARRRVRARGAGEPDRNRYRQWAADRTVGRARWRWWRAGRRVPGAVEVQLPGVRPVPADHGDGPGQPVAYDRWLGRRRIHGARAGVQHQRQRCLGRGDGHGHGDRDRHFDRDRHAHQYPHANGHADYPPDWPSDRYSDRDPNTRRGWWWRWRWWRWWWRWWRWRWRGRAPAAPPVPTRSPLVGRTTAATALERAGDLLVIQRHDQPGVEIEVGVGWISRDGQRIITIGFVRDGDLGQTYAVVRREGDGRIVRRWIAPTSPLVYAVPWAVVNTQYTFPVDVILAIPLDEQYPAPHMLMRRFDGGDDRILAYDAARRQWRHVPDLATFQALGFYWCNVTAADAGFFARITLGPAYPASSRPARSDYPVCQP